MIEDEMLPYFATILLYDFRDFRLFFGSYKVVPIRSWTLSWWTQLQFHYGLNGRYIGISINGGTQNDWFTMENTIKMDDWGAPLFQETTIYLYLLWFINQQT